MCPNRSLHIWLLKKQGCRKASLCFAEDGTVPDEAEDHQNRFTRNPAMTITGLRRSVAAAELSLMALINVCLLSETGYASSLCPRLPSLLYVSVPEIRSCRQLIIVTTNDWNHLNANIQLFERENAGETPWRKTGKRFPGVIGKHGFGWGIGLHGVGEPGAPIKREGDQKSPAGIFRLYSIFGTASPSQMSFLRLPYEQIRPSTEAIDDPRSRYYNRIVDGTGVRSRDWSSSESMLAVGGRYKLGVMLEHNWSQIPGFGSCIFFHVWDRNQKGTAGCTAASSFNLGHLIRWLDADKNPLIVQLPITEYLRLKRSWELP